MTPKDLSFHSKTYLVSFSPPSLFCPMFSSPGYFHPTLTICMREATFRKILLVLSWFIEWMINWWINLTFKDMFQFILLLVPVYVHIYAPVFVQIRYYAKLGMSKDFASYRYYAFIKWVSLFIRLKSSYGPFHNFVWCGAWDVWSKWSKMYQTIKRKMISWWWR